MTDENVTRAMDALRQLSKEEYEDVVSCANTELFPYEGTLTQEHYGELDKLVGQVETYLHDLQKSGEISELEFSTLDDMRADLYISIDLMRGGGNPRHLHRE